MAHVSDPPEDPHSSAGGNDTLADAVDPGPVEAPSPGAPDRREYLRQLSGDAVVTVGRLTGLSTLLGRSLSAAGGSVVRDLSAFGETTDPVHGPPDVPPDDDAMEDDGSDTTFRQPSPADPDPKPVTTPDPVERLTADQHAFLNDPVTATLAINDPTGPPYLGVCRPAWDGATFRIPSQLFGARATLIERDPLVSMLIEAPDTGAWVMIGGVARLEDPRPAEDTVIIALRPTRFVWRPSSRG